MQKKKQKINETLLRFTISDLHFFYKYALSFFLSRKEVPPVSFPWTCHPVVAVFWTGTTPTQIWCFGGGRDSRIHCPPSSSALCTAKSSEVATSRSEGWGSRRHRNRPVSGARVQIPAWVRFFMGSLGCSVTDSNLAVNFLFFSFFVNSYWCIFFDISD